MDTDPIETPLQLLERNDETLLGTLAQDETPIALDDVDLQMFIKPSRHTPDDDATVVQLAVGTGITLGPGPGQYEILVPGSALAAGDRWYHVDAVIDGRRRTPVFGPLYVINT